MAHGTFHGVVDNGVQMQIVHPFNQKVQSLEIQTCTFIIHIVLPSCTTLSNCQSIHTWSGLGQYKITSLKTLFQSFIWMLLKSGRREILKYMYNAQVK